VASIELFGTLTCQYTRDAREWLEMRGVDFVEHDVEHSAAARRRWRELAGDAAIVPVVVEEGRVTRVGWQGHGCAIGD
jgi:glutaredoxin 3